MPSPISQRRPSFCENPSSTAANDPRAPQSSRLFGSRSPRRFPADTSNIFAKPKRQYQRPNRPVSSPNRPVHSPNPPPIMLDAHEVSPQSAPDPRTLPSSSHCESQQPPDNLSQPRASQSRSHQRSCPTENPARQPARLVFSQSRQTVHQNVRE